MIFQVWNHHYYWIMLSFFCVMASIPLGWRTKWPSPWPTLILEMDLKISTNFNMLWIFRMDPRKPNGWNHAKMCGFGYVFFLFQGWKHQTNMFSFSGFRFPIHTLVFIFILILRPAKKVKFQFHWSPVVGKFGTSSSKKVDLFSFLFLFPSNESQALYWRLLSNLQVVGFSPMHDGINQRPRFWSGNQVYIILNGYFRSANGSRSNLSKDFVISQAGG